MLVREKGAARGDAPETAIINKLHKASGSYFSTYSPVPIWLTSAKTAFMLNSTAYSAWINNCILVWDHSAQIVLI